MSLTFISITTFPIPTSNPSALTSWTDLQAARPRFIIEVTAIDKPWVSGPDTSREFSELREFLDSHYSIEVEKDDYVIYERLP